MGAALPEDLFRLKIRNQKQWPELNRQIRSLAMNNGISLKAKMAAGVVALAAIAVSAAPVEARDGRNAAAAAGVVGGLAAGAAIGAATQPRYYEGGPAYGAYAPVRERRVVVEDDDNGECYVKTRRVYVNGVMRVRRSTVCE
jgi:hypothetical protein